MNQKIHSGQVFSMLTTLKKIRRKKGTARTYWLCRCECGKETEVTSDKLRAGRTKSCGCFKNEWNRTGQSDESRQREYTRTSYDRMMDRCYNPKHPRYKYYGERGVIVCEKWKNSFDDFLADMGHRSKGTTIDRVNGEGNYEPSNCRWATMQEQNDNKVTSMWLEHGGHRAKLVDVCRALNLDRRVIYGRIKTGWDLRRALTEPTRPKKPNRQK